MYTVLPNPQVAWFFARSQPIQERWELTDDVPLPNKDTKWFLVDPESFTHIKQITMKDDQCYCPPVKNVYPDEEKKKDVDAQNELELMLKIMDLLDDYGYYLEASLEDGVPVFGLVKG